jgi:MFS family permease
LCYLLAATLVRSADGGAAVGLVTLAVSTSRHGGGGAALGGGLAALITAPQIAGPWLARLLEKAPDERLVLAGSFVLFGTGLAGAAVLLGTAPIFLVAVLITVAGLCGPLVTGGLSSRLAMIVRGGERAQRRAEGWDAGTYGIGNTAGPAIVAGTAAIAGPRLAVVALGAAAVLAGLLVMALPMNRGSREQGHQSSLPVRETLRAIVNLGPLRRIMVATTLTSLSTGGVMVVAVILGSQLGRHPSAGAALGAAYGVGNLCGSAVVGTFPLRGEPERLALRWIAANAGAIALCACAPAYLAALATFALAGATSSILFTATLAVRSVYSPPRARAQVFVTMAGLKMAAASAGTALAGALVGIGPRLVLVIGSSVTSAAVLIALTDRRISQQHHQESSQAPSGDPGSSQ